MGLVYWKIKIGDDITYYPAEDLTLAEAMEDAKSKAEGKKVSFEGKEIACWEMDLLSDQFDP
jgi:hypothetical protein